MKNITIALVITLAASLIVAPAIDLQPVQADKGGVPNTHSAGHGKGRHGSHT